MRREDDGWSAPRWRALLEARWRSRLAELTELSLAYHAAAADDPEDVRARRLLHRAVAARQRLADSEEALGRVAAGSFGRCEECAELIPAGLLAAAPESRYCGRCAAAQARTAGSVVTGTVVTGGAVAGGAVAGGAAVAGAASR
jgi:DnaK suppressor protein